MFRLKLGFVNFLTRIALSISILLLLFAGTFATVFVNHGLVNQTPRNVAQAIPAGDTRVGIDCGLGTTQAVANATGYPLAPSEVDPTTAKAQTSCTWIGDAGQTSTGTSDGTTEPLVTDQDESLSLSSGSIGGGFTANVILIQNRTSSINGFDLQLQWNPAILHAVEFDQQNIPGWTPNILLTPVKTLDNTIGSAELAQVITGSAGGNITLFRIRFDVIGVGNSQLHLVNVGGGIVSPGPVVHSTIDGAFDSETFFDSGNSLHWNANFTQVNPISPGGSNGFMAHVGGGTGPYTYAWQFDSCNQSGGIACTFKTEASGNPAVATLPFGTTTGYRVAVNVTDSLGHMIQMVQHIPLTANLRDVSIPPPGNSFPVNTPQLFNASWIGGVPPYIGNLRLCPGTTSNNICTLPNTAVSGTGQNVTRTVTYKLAGVYTDTLSITDSTPAFIGSPATQKIPLLVNVTGAPRAYNVSVSAPSTSSQGNLVTISAHIAYYSGYPTTLEATKFTYMISFGDGMATSVTSGTSMTASHVYSAAGNHTIRILAMESGSVSQIQEVGYASVFIQPSTGFNYSINLTPTQASIVTGESTTASVSVTTVNGTAEIVGLHAIFSITGVSINFIPNSGTPSYSSTMTITSQTSTPNGSYTITIVGNSTSGIVRQTTFMLLVGPRPSGSPMISVFSAHYGSANITDTSLKTGSTFSVQVNVTNAPTSGWNGYEFVLYYDQRYINITNYDYTTNTVFPNPYVGPGTFNGPGALRMSIVNLGPVFTPSGILVNVTFQVVKAGGVSPLVLAAGMAETGTGAGIPAGICPGCPGGAPNWSRLVSGTNVIGVTTTNGYFKNSASLGPIASFTVSPSSPTQGQTVTLDASNSFDPDNNNGVYHGIVEYMWDFGDTSPAGNLTTSIPIVTHAFSHGGTSGSFFSGNYSIRLTVIDSDNNFEGMTVQLLTIKTSGIHDVAVTSLTIFPQIASEGTMVQVFVSVSNLGAFTETYNFTVTYGPTNQTLTRTLQNLIPSGVTLGYTLSLNTSSLTPGPYNIIAQVSDSLDQNPSNNAQVVQLQVTVADERPTAIFTYNPTNPTVGENILFNATSSTDPDGNIYNYAWNFGDYPTTYFSGPLIGHSYDFPGNYTVTLSITDTNGQSATTTQLVHVLPRPAHDVALFDLYSYPNIVIEGETVTFSISIHNVGSMDSTVNATIYYNGKIATTLNNLYIPASYIYSYNTQWSTAGVTPGNYTISATVFLAGDPTPGDNSYTDGRLTILPPPVVTATPTSGPVGTTVTLHAKGFPIFFNGPITNEFLVSFDNQFVGYSFSNGTFTFTFNIPLSQPGLHTIHVLEVYPSFLDITTTFTVTGTASNNLTLTVSSGTIYFPGDTATIFVQTSLNGTPTTLTSLQAILVKPDNTNTTLKITLLTSGVYKTTYTIPSTGPLGTYAIIIKAHQTGTGDTQSLTTFEVKLSWLASQGKTITAGVAITGLVGVAALAWHKGYFKRKDEKEKSRDYTFADTFSSP